MQTTERHFAIFKTEVLKWLDILGLKNWEVSIRHHEVDEESRATCEAQSGAQMATISLSTDWDIKPNSENIKKTAFHEVLELFLEHFDTLARERVILPREIEVARHSIIRTLENVLFPKY